MRGENDDTLASLCDGCRNYIEVDDFGKEGTDQETDRLLLAGRPDVDYPAPKVDLRRTFRQHPREWDRMSAIQGWHWDEEYRRLREIRFRPKRTHSARSRGARVIMSFAPRPRVLLIFLPPDRHDDHGAQTRR